MKPSTRFVSIYLLLGALALYLHLHADVQIPANKPFSEFPRTVAEWQMTSQSEFSAGVLRVLKAADYFSRQYTDTAGNRVSLYLGYYSGGKDSGGIHSPKHCLPGSGWFELWTKRGMLDLPAGRLRVVRAVYQKGGQKELYLYWFQVREKTLSDEYSLKLAEITNSLFSRRRDSAFVRISVPFDTDQAKAIQVAERFARAFYPSIQEFLPH